MSDLTLLPLPATLSDFASPSLPGQARLQDQSLSLQASARSRESQQELHALIAQAPGVRDSIEQLLIEHWQLGAAPVGLGFLKTEDHDEHFVSLVDAWGFICQFPDISPTLDARSTVVGLASHSLSALTPVQVLKRLQALDLRKLLSVRWENYWNTRAPGTPLSRRERAAHLYCQHFEACGQLTYAQGKLSAQQLISLQTVLNPITAPNGVRPVETCQLALRLPDQSNVKLPGAWVITVRQEPLLTQTLYLPCRQPGVMVFSQRSDMERWLVAADQQLVPPDVAADAVTVEYSSRTEALEHGILDLLSHLHAAQLESLRNRHRNGSDLARFARHALDDADRLDSQRREIPILIAPPQPAGTPGPDADDLPPALPFGHLSADIALDQRWAAIKQQRSALERFLGDGPEQPARLAQLKVLMQALKDAEQAGNDAASGLLAKKAAFDQLELRQKPNPHYDALYQARISALHRSQQLLERELEPFDDFGQRRLGQRLRDDFQLEHAWSVQLDLPDAVSQEREYLSEYAGPGTPFKYVTVPSSRRSTLSLLQLAQQNIDPTLAQRLTYMKLDVTGPDAHETTRLTTGLSLEYLKTLVKELDLAGAYESLITRTFLGEQRNLGLQWQVAQAQAGATVDPIWRGNIGRPMATRHFAGV